MIMRPAVQVTNFYYIGNAHGPHGESSSRSLEIGTFAV